jgi:type III restriction enzyme
MSNDKNLYETIAGRAWELKIPFPNIPASITENLKYPFYDWQEKAFINFLTYQKIKAIESNNEPTHLMFNMATGTGKTLLMAASILFYYQMGYRKFIFFVNQNNIVDKTENNFVNSSHNKYLFRKKIIIDNREISIKKVDNFSSDSNDIEIKFTTVQKLYNDIHIEKENQVLLDDLIKKDIVMIGDEAHHLNANTKKKSSQFEMELDTELTAKTSLAEIERRGWEHTVIELILKKRNLKQVNKNVLLEFTATIPDNLDVTNKYKDKIIYKFSLKEFLGAGYTKEINLISSTFQKKERIIQALLFSWYREKIALKYFLKGNKSLNNFKPVLLFRSKSIDDSRKDYKYFSKIIKNLDTEDFNFLGEMEKRINSNGSVYEQGKSRTRDLIEFIKRENISFLEIVENLKYSFSSKNCIITNSKDNTTKKEKTNENQEKLLNSLEDQNNHIRAIFTVDRLTEGWDVLNLYDIVRLYQGQNTGGSTKKTPEATIKEKQLIGRGVRYYPFEYENSKSNKRKFDSDIKNELRVLEELYYYTYDEESRYISHLKEELKKDGYIRDDKIIKTFRIKPDFQESSYYNDVMIWYNDQIDNPNRRKTNIEDIPKDFYKGYKITNMSFNEEKVVFSNDDDINRLKMNEMYYKTLETKLYDYDKHIFYKALNIKGKEYDSLFHFSRLQIELDITSIDDLIDERFLGSFDIPIFLNKEYDFNKISNEDKLNILVDFLEAFSTEFEKIINPKKGSEFKAASFEDLFGVPKVKSISINEESSRVERQLVNEDWYVLDSFQGTSQEIELITEIKNTIANLQNKYAEVYLLRNEEVYKIYDFETGQGFQPDFLLFLKSRKSNDKYYQIFIEPKGEHLIEKDAWKNTFLDKITRKYGDESNDILVYNSKNYKLIGLPLYNSSDNKFKVHYSSVWGK